MVFVFEVRLHLFLPSTLGTLQRSSPCSALGSDPNDRVDTSFYVEYFYCSGCHLNLCVNCHSSHAKTHAQNLSLFTTMPWSVKSKDFEDNGSCAKCSRDAKCRVECTACLWSICLRCFNVSHLRDQWFENHRDDHSSKDHKRYRRIVPPYFSLNPVTSDICKCLSGSGVWGHCQRCHEGY